MTATIEMLLEINKHKTGSLANLWKKKLNYWTKMDLDIIQ